MVRRRWIERLAASGLGVRVARRAVAKVALMAVGKGVDAVGAMGAIGIVERVRRCRLAATRKLRWTRLGVLLRAIMLLLTTKCWMQRRVWVGKRKRLVRVLRERMVSAGGVDVADGGGDAELRVRLRRTRRWMGIRRMSLV
jgi:hypothetical protein